MIFYIFLSSALRLLSTFHPLLYCWDDSPDCTAWGGEGGGRWAAGFSAQETPGLWRQREQMCHPRRRGRWCAGVGVICRGGRGATWHWGSWKHPVQSRLWTMRGKRNDSHKGCKWQWQWQDRKRAEWVDKTRGVETHGNRKAWNTEVGRAFGCTLPPALQGHTSFSFLDSYAEMVLEILLKQWPTSLIIYQA